MCPGKTKSGKGVVQTETGGPKKKQNIRKFFFQIKQSVGLVEKTEISKNFSDSLVHLDNYKICLDTLAEAVCCAIQENPKYRKEDYKMHLLPPDGEEENELVASCLKNSHGLDDYKNQKNQIDLYEKRGKERREYIRRARRTVQNIRAFIQNDYWVIGVQRTELDTLRREMDFAKSELEAEKDEQLIAVKDHLYKMAVSAYENKLKQLTAMLNELPSNKACHVADLEEWIRCTRKYHEQMALLSAEGGKG
ncbi:unnamed protein product [Angiostrongylus costaricensis]|uniref:BAR domain-containing protein n=1 Tax=Angiostrongylus costaricensis TaxID=334426 RepID=A0A0R3PN62_ANGCS|nr:unnamed protein product [Angiostrongylus costaricensis]